LIAAKKKIVILSNTSRRAKDAKGKLPGFGFDLELITGLVCSGEEAWKHIQSEFGGKRCTWLTWEREEEAKGKGDGFLDGLDVTTADVEDADFILCHGYDEPGTRDHTQAHSFLVRRHCRCIHRRNKECRASCRRWPRKLDGPILSLTLMVCFA
jgi:hypothetical protein